MNSYEERAKKFIQKVYPFIEDDYEPDDVKDSIDDFNFQYNRHVIVKHGIARTALITSDYVVKFDYDESEVAYVGGCEEEMTFYTRAEADGFGYLFAKISRYQYNERTFYIMPRVYGIKPNSYEYAQHYMSRAERNWCSDMGLQDLHCNNYGFRNGHVCIFDYACTR